VSEELTESREDLTRMLDSFRHRERALLDDVETLRHRNATLSDLLDLVTERAESAQKELDRQRAATTISDGITDTISTGGGQTDALLQKDSEVCRGIHRCRYEDRVEYDYIIWQLFHNIK